MATHKQTEPIPTVTIEGETLEVVTFTQVRRRAAINDAAVSWSTHHVDEVSRYKLDGLDVTAISRSIWRRHTINGEPYGAEQVRRIWVALAPGFSDRPSRSDASLSHALRNLSRRIRKAAK